MSIDTTDERPARQWPRRLLEYGLIIAVFLGAMAWQARHLLPAGEPVPNMAFATMDGDVQRLTDYVGKTTLVVFWAPWCSVCGAESDNISRVKSWLGDRIHVVSVAVDYGSEEKVQAFMDKQKVDYPVLLDPEGLTAEAFQIRSFPTLYVLDEQGRVKRSVVGYTTTLGMLWRTLL